MPVDLACHVCRYDLRAQPLDGQCPECGAPVAEARRQAAIPLRPDWRDSDSRWRRRLLAGAWVLVLLPLMDVLLFFELTSRVPIPVVYDSQGTVRTLDDTFVAWLSVYQPLAFCIGVVLLFSKERGRRRRRLDWTRRWGVLCCYVVFVLSVTPVLFLAALVLVGICAVFVSMPAKFQPEVTPWLIDVSAGYLRFGPHPSNLTDAALLAFASIAVLLACVRLFDGLRSSGPRWLAVVLLAPLAVFAVRHLVQVGRFCAQYSTSPSESFPTAVYFWPTPVIMELADDPNRLFIPESPLSNVYMEAAKWSIVLVIAVWLSVAQVASWRKHGRKAPAAPATLADGGDEVQRPEPANVGCQPREPESGTRGL